MTRWPTGNNCSYFAETFVDEFNKPSLCDVKKIKEDWSNFSPIEIEKYLSKCIHH